MARARVELQRQLLIDGRELPRDLVQLGARLRVFRQGGFELAIGGHVGRAGLGFIGKHGELSEVRNGREHREKRNKSQAQRPGRARPWRRSISIQPLDKPGLLQMAARHVPGRR